MYSLTASQVKFSNSLMIHQVYKTKIMTVTVFGYLILISIDFSCFSSFIFSLMWALIEKMYQTLKTVFDQISKHLEGHQKYSAIHCIFNSLLIVWKCGQTRSVMFDILHPSTCLVYNTSVHRSTGFTPSFLRLGSNLLQPVSYAL